MPQYFRIRWSWVCEVPC